MRVKGAWPFWVLRYALPAIAASLFVAGCSFVSSRSDVIGTYRLNVKSGGIGLRISEDGHFTEEILWPSGKHETRSGSWAWGRQGVIAFDQLWIPREFAPEYIQSADADATANRQPKYTEPGYFTVRPERHWGTIVLSVFPGNDEEFKKTK